MINLISSFDGYSIYFFMVSTPYIPVTPPSTYLHILEHQDLVPRNSYYQPAHPKAQAVHLASNASA